MNREDSDQTVLQHRLIIVFTICIIDSTEAIYCLIQKNFKIWIVVVVVDLLFYVHGKHLRSCRDGQLT